MQTSQLPNNHKGPDEKLDLVAKASYLLGGMTAITMMCQEELSAFELERLTIRLNEVEAALKKVFEHVQRLQKIP